MVKLGQLAKSLQMQQLQMTFNNLAKEHHAEIMEMRRNRDRAGLQELQEKLAEQAENIVKEMGGGLTDEQKTIYSTVGGTPHLDGQYTVFGEVEEGLEIVEAIQNVETAMGDRPKTDVVMTVTVLE